MFALIIAACQQRYALHEFLHRTALPLRFGEQVLTDLPFLLGRLKLKFELTYGLHADTGNDCCCFQCRARYTMSTTLPLLR